MKQSGSRSNDKSGGSDNQKQKKMQKAAVAPKGRMSQPKGSAKHNTSPRYSKKMKLGKTDFTDVEF